MRKIKTVKSYVILAGLLITLGIVIIGSVITFNKKTVGVTTVKLMYNFRDVEQLRDNMKKLKSHVTKDIYNKYNANNRTRAEDMYMKFRGQSSYVRVLKSTNDYVLYTLDCDALSHGRMFLMFYETDWLGRIIKIREMEGIDFEENYE